MEFELWTDGQRDVLVAFYDHNGETFGIWTDDTDRLPDGPEEEANAIDDLNWEVENMTGLRDAGFSRKEVIKNV